jgi:hypothetical protein
MTELPEEAVGLRILRLLAVERGLQDARDCSARRHSARRYGPRTFTRDWDEGWSKRRRRSSLSCAVSAAKNWLRSWTRRW